MFKHTILVAAVAGVVLALAGAADASVIVPNDASHVVSGTVTGTLIAIDPPKKTGDDGNVAGVGFAGTLGGDDGGSTRGAWEPDGTVAATQWHIGWVSNGTVSFTFDVPDGATINNVYAKWHGQSNQSSNVVYSYNEGSLTSATKDHDIASVGDLVLKWTDSLNATHNTNFERVFAGPITVAGGDGFTVTMDSRVSEFDLIGSGDTSKIMSIDAMVIDYTPEPATMALLALGGLGLILGRKRQ